MTNTVNGGCHCGNIKFRFKTDQAPTELPLRTCGCTFCLRQNGIYTSDPSGELVYSIVSREDVNRYQFGHKTADFHVCRKCGIVPFITSEIDSQVYGIVNLCATGDPGYSSRSHIRKDFEAESSLDRLSRRKQFWIGKVTEESCNE